MFTDGSVKRGVNSDRGFTVRMHGTIVAEISGAVDISTSSMLMEVKAITEALHYLIENQHRRAAIVTYSMRSLQKIQKKYLYLDWVRIIKRQHPGAPHLEL